MNIIDNMIAIKAEKLILEIEGLQEQFEHENYTTPISLSQKNKKK